MSNGEFVKVLAMEAKDGGFDSGPSLSWCSLRSAWLKVVDDKDDPCKELMPLSDDIFECTLGCDM